VSDKDAFEAQPLSGALRVLENLRVTAFMKIGVKDNHREAFVSKFCASGDKTISSGIGGGSLGLDGLRSQNIRLCNGVEQYSN